MPTLAQRLASKDHQRFVGRDRELAFFDRLLEADDPSASVVLVHGPGGIGKSTLLREVARRAATRGWQPRFVEGRDLAPAPGEIEAALLGVESISRPLIMFDTYERMTAADGWVRGRLVPSLPAHSLVVLAGRGAPEPAWFEGGWEQLVVELEMRPLESGDAHDLLRVHGLADDELADSLVAWADGLPLALSLAADAVRAGDSWRPDRIEDHPNLVRAIIRRLARTELDGGNLDVASVAAIARATDARMLRDVLPDVDPDEAEAWLGTRTFAEHVGGGIALHDLVRRALRADLRASVPERERELRRRIADHLHTRAVRGEPRLLVDLAQLIENEALRWGLGADGTTQFRADLARPEDADHGQLPFVRQRGSAALWEPISRFIREAPDRVITVRDVADRLCGIAICVTPDNAPPLAEEDAVLGPWLAHAREQHPGAEVLIWRDALDFVGHGDIQSPVLAILNTAAILRSGLTNPHFSYLPIDPHNEAAVAFAAAVGAQPVPELDVEHLGKRVRCHVLDHGAGGMLGAFRDAVYAELGLTPPAEPPAGGPSPRAPLTADAVRDALRNLEHPLDLAANPLAVGSTPDERAASVRRAIEEAVEGAFGESADEQLLRRVIERGYLDPAASHELAADELHVSRATYFRRLRTASQRVADWLIAKHSPDG